VRQTVIDAVIAEQEQIIARAQPYEENPDMVRSILLEGAEKAEYDARHTLTEVRQAMGLSYR
jgi:hypothetical protein